MKGITYFAGIGGVETGWKMAGIGTLASVEFDKDNSNFSEFCQQQHELNFPGSEFHLKDVRQAKIELPSEPIWFHASPVCSQFSQANIKGKENGTDKETAGAVAGFIYKNYPKIVTIENVRGYQQSESYKIISKTLSSCGYRITEAVIDMADYGIPQNRVRLFTIACKTHKILIPPKQRPIGWKEAIKGIKLEPDSLSDRQLITARNYLETYQAENLLIQRVGASEDLLVREGTEPCWTLLKHYFTDGQNSRSKVITAITDGEIFNLPLKAIARLQGFPDWYKWSSLDPKLAGCGLGYSVPPGFIKLVSQQILATLS